MSTRIVVDGISENVNGAQPLEVLYLLRDTTLGRLQRTTDAKERYENAAIGAASDIEALAEALDRYNTAIAAVEAANAPAPVATVEEPVLGIEEAAA